MPNEPISNVDSTGKDKVIDHLMTDEPKNRIIEFMQHIFSRSERFFWSPDEVNAKISISDIFPTKEDYEKKPAIVIRRENTFLTNRGIGHFHSWTFSKNFGSRYVDLLQSQMVIECYSREGLEAEKIANIVFASLLFYRKKLREVGRIHDVLAANIGPEAPQRVSSAITLSMVPVMLSFKHAEMWTTEQIGKDVFNGIQVDILIKD